ncbi:MAG: glycosyltransferase family 2 protein [Candidatus Doudnabacteria bacterium]|nr:glycosyltransferase family 2 protein [Candidatus Doudnabacteria bacterium]
MIVYLKQITKNFIVNDWLAAKFFLLVLVVYCVWYGFEVSHGWVFNLPNYQTLIQVLLLFAFVDGLRCSIESLFPRTFVEASDETGDITVIIPTVNGEKVLPETIRDLVARFDRENIIVVSNGSMDRTAAVAQEFGVRVLDIKAPIGKVGAIHEGLSRVRTKYTMLIDDDTRLGVALFPMHALENGCEGVAFRVLPYVNDWITALQMYEYRKSMDLSKPHQNWSKTVQNVSGAVGVFHTTELTRQLDTHSGEFSGEDLQRTLLIHASAHTQGVVISDAVVFTEVPDSFRSLWKQRVLGWNPGMYANFGLYIKVLFAKHTPWLLRVDAFYNTVLVSGLDIFRLLLFPVVIFYPVVALLFYILYLLLELLPYVALGKTRGPLWVIFITPIYGMINFVARAAAAFVFTYRRLAVRFGGYAEKDDYRKAGVRVRLGAYATSAWICAVVFSGLIVNASPEINLSLDFELLSEAMINVGDKIKAGANAIFDLSAISG